LCIKALCARVGHSLCAIVFFWAIVVILSIVMARYGYPVYGCLLAASVATIIFHYTRNSE
jgi:hypothetical protein